jgi:hypothetical protein
MKKTALATAIELARLFSVAHAAAYLSEKGVAVDVALELLVNKPVQNAESA